MGRLMINVSVFNTAGQVLEQVQLDESVLGGQVRRVLVRQAVLAHEANQRAGTAKTKTRGEVSHPDRKPWPQKHTGRARAGTPNSPIWVGGGVAHGPVPRDYTQKLNKKMRRRAVQSALLAKLREGRVKIVDSLQLPRPKTKEVARILKGLGVERRFLLVLSQHDELLWRCTRNIPGAAVMTARELNAYEMLKARDLVFITRAAFDEVLKEAQKPSTPEPAGNPAEAGGA